MKAPLNTSTRSKKEALIVMITILFIEEHGLLRQEDLEDAKKSLQALFLRASGAGRRCSPSSSEVLRATRRACIRPSPASSLLLTGIGKGRDGGRW